MTHPHTEPLPRETAKAFAAFCVYRDMGKERSLEKVAQESNKSRTYKTHLARWSTAHHWVERAKAHDAELAEIDRQALIQARRDAHQNEIEEYRRQLTISSKAALQVGQRTLNLLLKRLQEVKPEELDIKDLSGLIRASSGTIEKAMDGWGVALGVDELMEMLGDDE